MEVLQVQAFGPAATRAGSEFRAAAVAPGRKGVEVVDVAVQEPRWLVLGSRVEVHDVDTQSQAFAFVPR